MPYSLVLRPRTTVALIAGMLLCGCGTADTPADKQAKSDPPVLLAPSRPDDSEVTPSELHARLGDGGKAQIQAIAGKIRAVSLFQSGVEDITPLTGLPLYELDLTGVPVSDLSPLRGMPLRALFLEQTSVSDLSPLQGMSLEVLRMEHTPVEDITPLAGMPLKQLNLFDTKVQEISAVREMPLNTLWLRESAVKDIIVLQGKQLESLDIEQTSISDLSPLAGMKTLRRLNIAGSKVTDLTPLRGLPLERLIFTPETIQTGMDVVQSMPTLQQVGRTFETVQPAAQFWAELAAEN